MATWLSGISRQHRIIRKNVFLWFGLFLLAFVLIIARFGWIQLVEGGKYRKLGAKLYKRTLVLPFKRGPLVDRNCMPMAVDSEHYTVYADPDLIPFPDFTAAQLARVLNLPVDDVLAKLTEVTIASRLTRETTDAVGRLQLPGIRMEAEGTRLRIGVDWSRIDNCNIFTNRLGKTLNIPVKALRSELGVKVIEPAPTPAPAAPALAPVSAPATRSPRRHARRPAQPTAPSAPTVQFSKPSGTTWLSSSYPAGAKAALDDLKARFPGLLYQSYESFRITGDQRQYAMGQPPVADAGAAAAQLAAILGQPADRIKTVLAVRSHYAKVKADITEDELKAVRKLLGTMFVVQPGRILDTGGKDPAQQINEAVRRLDDMLNERGQSPQVSPDVIRQRLAAGAAPGPLGVKLLKDDRPDIEISRRLFAVPIPGVIYGLPGIGVQEESGRNYPFARLASAALGWVGDARTNPHGVFGLEEYLEDKLRGKDGREEKEIDLRRRTMPERSQRTEPINGLGAMLTIDLTIQQAAEEWLNKYVQGPPRKGEPGGYALRGQCVVLDPNTGDILALATSPAWDANQPSKSTIPIVNPAISNFYEPGSAYKIVAVMGALEEGLIHDGELVTNCTGAFGIGKRVIHEAHGEQHGAVDSGGLLEKSCNIGAARLALKLGPQRFLAWCERLGFGQKTGIELGQESPGLLNRDNVHADITLANMGFGQSLAVTPVQMAAAYAAIANGGEWVQPHLIKGLQQKDGSFKDLPPAPRRRVCSKEIAALMRGYLARVVSGKHGTGKRLSLKDYGFNYGGKTGTAQKPGPHGYSSGSYIASFVGVLPIETPRLVIIAVIDEPRGAYYGALAAGPVVKEVGLRALQYLNVPPTIVPSPRPPAH